MPRAQSRGCPRSKLAVPSALPFPGFNPSRFLKVNGLRPRVQVQSPLDPHAQKFPEVLTRTHIIDIPAVADPSPGPVGLRFVLVVQASNRP